ncbi:dTMP kinase [Campylobacter sp. 9BO]|uniref:dTMP kinase n=1 Tax=Campylobacter sp. 9BO TaxID=3424759 RepID=UPI003D33D6FB
MYVLFEGIDGVGKSTQISLLARKFPNAIVTKEPGGSEFGKFARQILLENNLYLSSRAELLLFLADRAEHMQKLIMPNKDKLILSDRGFVSGISYAITNDKSLNIKELLAMNEFALNGVLPEKIIFFYADKTLVKQRLFERKTQDKIEARGLEYLLKVQENMHKFLQSQSFDTLFIDASKNVDQIHSKIVDFLGI